MSDPSQPAKVREAFAILAEYVAEAQIASVVFTTLQNKDVVISIMQRPGDQSEPYMKYGHSAKALKSCR